MIDIIAEIGINHNGSVDVAKQLINVASVAQCTYAKFQKRTPELCVPDAQKEKLRNTPWGRIKYIDYKNKIEFGKEEYDQIDKHCKQLGISWFASVWDIPSVDFMTQYTTVGKVPSALITDHELMCYAREKFDTLMISTGMSTESEIEAAIEIAYPDVIFHTNSSYPSKIDELNLKYITYLKDKYPTKTIGYSGHEFGLTTTFATVPLGVEIIERHITLDRTMWGSDHMASVEPHGLIKLVKGIRNIESALGAAGPRTVLGSELQKRKSLRG